MEEGEVCDLKWTEVKGEVWDLNFNGKNVKRRKGRRKSTTKMSTMRRVSPQPLCTTRRRSRGSRSYKGRSPAPGAWR